MTNDQLEEIERLSSLFLSPKEIAIYLDIDIDQFNDELLNEESQIFKHYFKGKLKSKIEIRENIIKLAKHGSPQAQLMIKDFIQFQDNAENI